MHKLDHQGMLRYTPTILHLVDRSIVNLEGVLGDVIVVRTYSVSFCSYFLLPLHPFPTHI